MPRLWTATLEGHRRAVHDATLETAAALVAERGLRAVTMSQIAQQTGIGRATLYKYFPDVESIVLAWHERQIAGHVAELSSISAEAGDPPSRLKRVLERYALIQHELRLAHGTALAAFLHRDSRIAQARRMLIELIADVLSEAAAAGYVRSDVAPRELAAYCLHALAAAAKLPSKRAVRRLVAVTLAGLRPDDLTLEPL